MNYEIATILAAWASLAWFIWTIHKDIGDLRERMVRLETAFDGFKERLIRLEGAFDGFTGRTQA